MKKLLIAITLVFISYSAFAADMPANAYPLPWQSPSQPRILLEDGTVVGADNPLPVDIGASVEIGSVTVDAFPVYKDESGTPATAELDSNGYVKTNFTSDSIGLIAAINSVTTAIINFDLSGVLSGLGDIETAINNISVSVDTIALEAAQASTTASIDAANTKLDSVRTDIQAVETAVNNISVGVDTADLEAAQASTTVAVEELKQPIAEVARQVVALTANTASNITSGLTGDRKFIHLTTMDNTKDFYVDFNNTAIIGSCLRVYGGYYFELPKTVSISVIASEALDIFVLEGGFQ
ncbi:MAG: hypothetical protein AB1403_11290 [Candidatus Riflebacteria bacterium]